MKYLVLLALCCTEMMAVAQKKTLTTVHPLAIGDTVPDFTFKKVLNYKTPTAKLSDFKGKVIILDMWSIYCTSCIEAFPKMQALQDKFKDKIQVLLVNPYPVTTDPDARISQVLARVKQRTGLTLTVPMPLHDTMLNHLFPHQTVPHVIVINEKGILIGATFSWAVTTENVESILAGEEIHLPVKNDWGFDKNTPLFINGNGGDGSDFIYRSIITPFKDGVPAYAGTISEEDGKALRFYVINYPLFSIYQMAYGDVFKYNRNRTFIETDDPTRFELHYNENEDNKNSYCYEVTAPSTSGDTMMQYMREDLRRSFHAIARNEERVIKCYLLKTKDNTKALFASNDSSGMDIEKTSLHKYIHNKPVVKLADMLNNILAEPVIDETGLTNNISIDFPTDIYDYDIQQWKDFLLKQGLALIDAERKLEVTVITGYSNN